jgi:hypothetical protein
VIERAWREREAAQAALALERLADAVEAAALPLAEEQESDVEHALGAAGGPPGWAPMPTEARLGERVTVRVGGHPIEVTIDRVDGAPGGRRAGESPPSDASPPDTTDAHLPAVTTSRGRLVRHKLGRGGATDTEADLRTLLYALAAEQVGGDERPALAQHNLTTGVLTPLSLDPKREARLRSSLLEALAGLERGEYPARPDPFTCQACPFLLICPA